MITLRYSQIAQLIKCPRQFELRYIQGIKTPSQSYLVLGKGMHYGIAENYRFKMAHDTDMPLPDVLDLFGDAWEKEQFGPEDEDDGIPIIWDEDKGYLKDVGIDLLKSYHYRIAPHITPLAVEESFTREISGIMLESRPDLITDTAIVDHKTSKRRKAQLEADRDIQPTIHLLVSNTPNTNYEFHCLLKLKVPTTERVITARQQWELDWLTNQLLPPIIRMLEEGLFPPLGIGGWICNPEYCSYWSLCRR